MNVADTSGISHRLTETEDFSRTVTAFFDNPDHARTARQDLIASGIADGAVSIIAGDTSSAVELDADQAPGGFWETLKELFLPEDHQEQVAEGVRRGGASVVVRTDTANHDRVVALLDRDGAVDLDERQESWRAQGWTGATGRDPLADAHTPALAFAADEDDLSYLTPSPGTAGFGASAADHFPILDEEAAAPAVESPGALPPSALDALPDKAAASPDTRLGTGRVRSYVVQPGQDRLPPTAESIRQFER